MVKLNMAEKAGRSATDDVVAIRPGGEMVDPRKIIPGEKLAHPQMEPRDDTKGIRGELDKQAETVAESPTEPAIPIENKTTLHGKEEAADKSHLKTHGIAYSPRQKD
jgi:hypothetical protein